MRITRDEEDYKDIDWYAVDPQGAIGHFATGSKGFLPTSSCESAEDLDAVWQYLQETPPVTRPIVTKQGKREAEKSRISARFALESFMEHASKGVYSYDTVYLDRRLSPYYLVAAPERPIHISDVPEHIRRIIERTKCRIAFETASSIVAEDILPGPERRNRAAPGFSGPGQEEREGGHANDDDAPGPTNG